VFVASARAKSASAALAGTAYWPMERYPYDTLARLTDNAPSGRMPATMRPHGLLPLPLPQPR
jgi:hypothetical protein